MTPNPQAPVQKKGLSPIVWVLLGCGGLALLIFLGFFIAGALLVRQVKNMADGITDPAAKEANVKGMLGTVPQGYYPAITFSLPMVMDMAMLTDVPFNMDGGPNDFQHAFLYFRVISTDETKKVRDFFDGKTQSTDTLRKSGIQVDAKDILKRGTVKTAAGLTVKYVATRGGVSAANSANADKAQLEGLNTLLSFECPGDTALRIGTWTEKEETPHVDLTGTVADESQITTFVGPLTPCG
ncbi:MAG: hypothetical protein K1X89_17785 [Myxococcaceae bacterium]|nr:hypothetical protein [Myxococcaceae bacterium]